MSRIAYEKIDSVFEKAHDSGRSVLFEFEVYDVLSHAGLDVPHYVFIDKPGLATEEVLSQFGDKIVVKVVSKDIAHKQKLGGVKVVSNSEPLFVQFVLFKMKEEVLAHFNEDEKPGIEGFLIVEFIDFTQSLGSELLIGVKNDDAFGPVVTLSKGGDDAEFFAKYYDPANLSLPYMTTEEADELAGSLKIINKFNDIGHPEYKDYIARAAEAISMLAFRYSDVSEDQVGYHILSMDVNPFVFSKSGRFIAVDGYVIFEKSDNKKKLLADETNIDAFFRPEGIAVIGVSRNENKYSMGREIATLLHELDRKDMYCINLRSGSTKICGVEYLMYQNLDQLPEDVDLAVYAAPAASVPDFLKNLGERKPKAMVMIPGIPADTGYEEFARLLDENKPEGMRIIGPNCMGVYYGANEQGSGVNTLFIEEERLKLYSDENSNAALLTQSGGMAITMIDKLRNNPVFKAIASFGNKYDVKITDLFSYFEKDESIDVIAVYVEGFDEREGRLFFELARSSSKPVIIYKGGKTEAGAQAAKSHTAAMTGDYDTFRAACIQAGVILTEDATEFMDCIKAFSLLADKKAGGMNVTGVLNAGFEATIASDELGHLKPAQVSAETMDALNNVTSHGLVDTSNAIIDVTPMTDDVMYGEFIRTFLSDPGVNAVIVGVVPHVENIKSTPETCNDENSLANVLVRIYETYEKPMVVSVNASEYYDEFVSIMEKGGIPVYTDIRSAVRSLETFMMYRNGL
ncbi:MAG: acetate--CoA ligase family protein [Clostridia bacterium]|nr:acetate--CoA ligase family protein [Clostridia bacterium]